MATEGSMPPCPLLAIYRKTSSPPPSPPPPPPMLQKNKAHTPVPPPPVMPIKGSLPPSLMISGGAPPPPPPPLPPPPRFLIPSMWRTEQTATPPPRFFAVSMCPTEQTATPPPRWENGTNLYRSAHMGSLHRTLKEQVEAYSRASRVTLADIMAEIMQRYPHIVQSEDAQNLNQITSYDSNVVSMGGPLPVKTRLSAFLVQIETEVQTYGEQISELRSAINSFTTSDMSELLKFHNYIESQLENLTDEPRILRRFQDFPETKLDAIRMAAALYTKLNAILTTLTNWKIESPLSQLLDKVEAYFFEMRGELEAADRSKDDVYKIFQHHKINFDFHILMKIKESLLDVSSGCMELALKEWMEARLKATGEQKKAPKWGLAPNGERDLLWKTFHFAYRVYMFVGGQDARFDNQAQQLANEIQIAFAL